MFRALERPREQVRGTCIQLRSKPSYTKVVIMGFARSGIQLLLYLEFPACAPPVQTDVGTHVAERVRTARRDFGADSRLYLSAILRQPKAPASEPNVFDATMTCKG